jgi:rubrerythrin
MQSRSFF